MAPKLKLLSPPYLPSLSLLDRALSLSHALAFQSSAREKLMIHELKIWRLFGSLAMHRWHW